MIQQTNKNLNRHWTINDKDYWSYPWQEICWYCIEWHMLDSSKIEKWKHRSGYFGIHWLTDIYWTFWKYIYEDEYVTFVEISKKWRDMLNLTYTILDSWTVETKFFFGETKDIFRQSKILVQLFFSDILHENSMYILQLFYFCIDLIYLLYWYGHFEQERWSYRSIKDAWYSTLT